MTWEEVGGSIFGQIIMTSFTNVPQGVFDPRDCPSCFSVLNFQFLKLKLLEENVLVQLGESQPNNVWMNMNFILLKVTSIFQYCEIL